MGSTLLVVCVVLASAATIAAIAGRDRQAMAAVWGASVAAVAATVRLAWLLVAERYEYAYVADNVRSDVGWATRVSALWAGADGSLLLFTAVVAVITSAGLVGSHLDKRRWDLALVSATLAGLATTTLLVADPFHTIALPPISGRGVTPILEHPAMVVHPPLLYVATAAALVPALRVFGGDVRAALLVTRAALALLTAALAIGAAWAYVELGWGGWWAWDPVENVGLIVWLLLVAALHARADSTAAARIHACAWPAVFAGTAMTRTSLRTSVHAFADAGSLAWGLWPVAALAAGAAVAVVASTRSNPPSSTSYQAPTKRVSVIAPVVTAVIVAIGTFRPFMSGATAGWFYTRTLAIPTAISVVAIVAVTLDRARTAARTLAHIGFLLVMVGAVAGTAGSTDTVRLDVGEQVEVDGRVVRLERLEVVEARVPTVAATLVIDGDHETTTSVAVHAERGVRLAEAGTARFLLGDVQVILRDADDVGAVVTVNVQPLIWTVWLGAILIAAGAATTLRRRRRVTCAASVHMDAPVAMSAR